MKTPLLAALAIAAVTGGAAQAQAFDGPFAGIQLGWRQDDVAAPTTDLGTLALETTTDSFAAGIFAGYDRSFGRFVLGGEIGAQFGSDDALTGAAGLSIDPKWTFEVSARAGYLVTPRLLVYARGGYANGRIETSVAGVDGTVTASENRNGWLVGGGLEYSLNPKLSARLEYRYTDLSEGEGKYDRNAVLVGLSYRF